MSEGRPTRPPVLNSTTASAMLRANSSATRTVTVWRIGKT